MSLRWYRMPRLVVLNPESTARDAARALESNNIGAVVVQDQSRLEGIVTDRDLATRVVGAALDPMTTRLGSVMTRPVVTLSPSASQSDAVRLMQQRQIRRIPLVEKGRLVGAVTLDDLILDETVPLDEVAAVVESQIGAGGVAQARRSPAAQRSAARAQATYGRLRNQLQADAGLESSEQAETALKVVLEAIVRRLMPGEAKDFISQLPSLLQSDLWALSPGPDKLITRNAIESSLSGRLDVSPQRAAQILAIVGETIAAGVTPGQLDDMRGQLPGELRSLLQSDLNRAPQA